MSIRKHKNLFLDDEIYPYLPKKNTKNTPSNNKRHQEKEKPKNKEKCCICYQSSDKITFINCKKGGVQFKNHGRGSACCKDKPICLECRQKCIKSCPFCRNHKLHIIETARYPKKKQPWIIRKMERQIKKKKKKENKRQVSLEPIMIDRARIFASSLRTYFVSTQRRLMERLDEIIGSNPQEGTPSRENNIFGAYYSNFDYTSIM